MKLGEVLTLDKNNTISIEDDKIYTIAGMQSYGKGVVNKRTEKGSDMKMKKYQVIKNNQLMWCKVDTKNGAFGVTTDENVGSLASTNMALASIDLEKVNAKFLQLLFTIPYFYNYINELCTGTTNRKYLKVAEVLDKIEIPDLSLEEQDKIIDKYYDVEKFHNELTQEISSQELYVNKLRQSILQEAVKGKLVPQDESDEPASVLLERIREEKERLVKEKKIKKEKPLPEISDDEIPYEIPKGWEWARLVNIASPENYSFVDGPFGSNLKREHYVECGIRIIQLQNIGEGYWKDSNKVYTSKEKADELIRCNAYPGELVIAKMAPVARTTIIPSYNERYVLCSDSVKLKPYKDINSEYIKYMMNSNIIKRMVLEESTGITRQRTSLGKLKSLIIPLPPSNEQKRIVEKVDRLMQVCDELELRIEKSKKYSEKLMESILKDSFKA